MNHISFTGLSTIKNMLLEAIFRHFLKLQTKVFQKLKTLVFWDFFLQVYKFYIVNTMQILNQVSLRLVLLSLPWAQPNSYPGLIYDVIRKEFWFSCRQFTITQQSDRLLCKYILSLFPMKTKLKADQLLTCISCSMVRINPCSVAERLKLIRG